MLQLPGNGDETQSGEFMAEDQIEKISAHWGDEIQKAIDDSTKRLKNRLLRHQFSILRGRRKRLGGFEDRLWERWQNPFNVYELCLYLAQNCGDLFNRSIFPFAVEKKRPRFEAIVRLHGNAALIAGEVLQLMKGGYPRGCSREVTI